MNNLSGDSYGFPFFSKILLAHLIYCWQIIVLKCFWLCSYFLYNSITDVKNTTVGKGAFQWKVNSLNLMLCMLVETQEKSLKNNDNTSGNADERTSWIQSECAVFSCSVRCYATLSRQTLFINDCINQSDSLLSIEFYFYLHTLKCLHTPHLQSTRGLFVFVFCLFFTTQVFFFSSIISDKTDAHMPTLPKKRAIRVLLCV